jgi:anaerobic selenocysteine-containing dehydrogenase
MLMASSKHHRSKAICPICSLQDGLILQWSEPTAMFSDSSLFAVDYDAQNPINEGSLCPRGNSVAELVDHPQRLTCPQVDQQEVDWPQAISQAADRLKKVAKSHGSEAVAILAGGCLNLDEARALDKLAREVLGTPNVAPLFPDDGSVFSRLERLGWDGGFSLQDLQERQAMLLVGDVFAEHPVISKRILRAKYKDRPHRLFVLDSVPTQTTWFAHQHLRPTPGTEPLVLAGLCQLVSRMKGEKKGFPLSLDLTLVEKRTGISQQQMETVAAALSSAPDGAIVQSTLYGRQGHPGTCALLGHVLSHLLAGRFVFLHLPVSGNGRGVYQMMAPQAGQRITGPGIVELILKGKIKGLFCFGTDPLSAVPSEKLEKALRGLKLLCAVEPLPTMTTPLANILLPAAIGPEKTGRVLYLNGDIQESPQAVPPPGLARPEGWIIAQLAERLSPGEEFSVTPVQTDAHLSKTGKSDWKELLKTEDPLLRKELSKDGSGEAAYPLFLVPAAVPAHLGDGALSRHFRWARRVCGEPVVWASAALMNELNVKEGDTVQVSSRTGRALFPLMLDAGLPENVITAPAHFPQVRGLFTWSLEAGTGELDVMPERVSLSLPKERR